MKKIHRNTLMLICLLFTTTLVMSQEKNSKEKLSEYDEIIIKKKNDKDAKVTLEIKDGVITANGKPLEDFEDETLSVRRRKTRIITTGPDARFRIQEGRDLPSFEQPFDEPTNQNPNKAFLGVLTKPVDNGVEIVEVTKESAAEKAGLKAGDIIIKVDADIITTPEDLVKSIGHYKPEDKIVITYKRAGKEAKTNAQLGKNNSQIGVYEFKRALPNGNDLREKLEDLNLGDLPNMGDLNFNWKGQGMPPFGPKPKLGIKIQDLETEKGVKILEVEKESPAEKAGLKANDIITSLNDKSIENTDALLEQVRASKEVQTIKMQILRDGKTQNVEIRIPKKLKTANL